MKNCTDCKYAEWKRTQGGKLHPSGEGRCQYPYKLSPLPVAYRWFSAPVMLGGHLNRSEELKEHCAYYVRKPE